MCTKDLQDTEEIQPHLSPTNATGLTRRMMWQSQPEDLSQPPDHETHRQFHKQTLASANFIQPTGTLQSMLPWPAGYGFDPQVYNGVATPVVPSQPLNVQDIKHQELHGYGIHSQKFKIARASTNSLYPFDSEVTASSLQQQNYVQGGRIFAPGVGQNFLRSHDDQRNHFPQTHQNLSGHEGGHFKPPFLDSDASFPPEHVGVLRHEGTSNQQPGSQYSTSALSNMNTNFHIFEDSDTPKINYGYPQDFNSGLPRTDLYRAEDSTWLDNNPRDLFPLTFENGSRSPASGCFPANSNNPFELIQSSNIPISSNPPATNPIDLAIGNSYSGPILGSSPAILATHQPRTRTRKRRAAKRGRAIHQEQQSVKVSDGQVFHKMAKEAQWRMFDICASKFYQLTCVQTLPYTTRTFAWSC